MNVFLVESNLGAFMRCNVVQFRRPGRTKRSKLDKDFTKTGRAWTWFQKHGPNTRLVLNEPKAQQARFFFIYFPNRALCSMFASEMAQPGLE